MVDAGDINEAENLLYDLKSEPESSDDKSLIKLQILFYSCLNEKDDAFLEAHRYSREEIMSGIRVIAAECGLEEMAGMLLEEQAL